MNSRIKKAFRNAKKDVDKVRFDSANYSRYLYNIAGEQQIRIREIERRLAQLERIRLREVMEE